MARAAVLAKPRLGPPLLAKAVFAMLLHTRNLQPARFCRWPGSLQSVQYSHLLSPVRCDSEPQSAQTMQKKCSVNRYRIEIVIKVSIEFAAAIRAFAAKLLQRQSEPSLLDSQRTKSPLVDVQRQLEPSLLGS